MSVALLLALLLTSPSLAAQPPIPALTGAVNDFANIIDAGSEAELRLVLAASVPVTPEILRARLARHPCLRQVEVSRKDRSPMLLAA